MKRLIFKKLKLKFKKDTCTPMSTAALNHKKKEIMPFAVTWINLEIIILNDISEKKTNIISLMFGRNYAKAETPVLWPPHVKC